MAKIKSQNKPKNNGKKLPKLAKLRGFSQQLMIAFVIFMVLTWGYSLVQDKKATPTIPLSEFATLVNQKQITAITIEGDNVTAVKIDKTTISSKKDNLITTSLYEANKLVYEIKEKNTYEYLHNISYTIYYLNRS